MPLDEATRRFSFLLAGDLRRLSDKREEYAARGEAMKFDSVTRIATLETRRGESVSRLYGEVLATYTPYDRIMRWGWSGRASSAHATHGDVIFREGQARGVPQLAMSVVGDLDQEDAATLVKLGALVARAEAIHERKVGGDVEFIGLFDRPRPSETVDAASRFSVPPPPVAERAHSSAPPPRAYRSIPPIKEIYEPRTGGSRPPEPVTRRSISTAPPPPLAAKKLREPSRALFLPVANVALAALSRGSKGYLQGLFVLTLDTAGTGTRRLMVQLVVIDTAGMLRALDPPTDVIEAAAAMVEADRLDGNGTWRKLSARITPKQDGGATLHVDVV
jgi:hypothetical protein